MRSARVRGQRRQVGDLGPRGPLWREPSFLDLASYAQSSDPWRALGAIAALKKSLDILEAETVRRARQQGASWEIISWKLGVSRQAAHAKHAKRLKAPRGET